MTHIWTPDHVRLRLREAFLTLARVPATDRDRPAVVRVFPIETMTPWAEAWANALFEIAEHGRQLAPESCRGAPSPGAIDRLDECLEWLLWTDPRGRLIVSMKAQYPRSTKALACRLGLYPKTVNNINSSVLLSIAARLSENEVKKKELDVGQVGHVFDRNQISLEYCA